MPGGIKCPRCKEIRADWCSYFCPTCNQHYDQLYVREHRDPDRAQSMTRRDIISEYAAAGLPYRRLECLWHEQT